MARLIDPTLVHHLTNKLAIIQGFADLLAADTPVDHPHHADLQEIAGAARSALALLADVDVEQSLEPGGTS